MRALVPRPMTYFITGFGRGGTTIFANALNSLENGFCLGEPYHHRSHRGVRIGYDWTGCGGKAGPYLSGLGLLGGIKSAMTRGRFDLGGYKETIEPVSDWSYTLLREHLGMVNFFLVVFRDPIMIHSSQRALNWNLRDTPADFIEDYRFLAELANTYPGIPLVYEDFAANPLDYLNGRLPFRIAGDFVLQPTGHEYGDPAANRATSIRRPDRKCNLTDLEIAAHEEARRIWASFRT